MRSEAKGRAGAGWFLVVAGVLVASGGALMRARARTPLPELTGAGAEARKRIEQALAGQARALEPKAAAGGRIRELQAALDMSVDRATCQDLLENEEWWSPFRSAFPLTAVIVDDPLAVVGPGVLGGLGGTGLGDSAIGLRRRAREGGVASGVLPGKGRAFLAAAATVPVAKRPGKTPVVLVGSPLDGPALKSLAESTGDVVGLADATTCSRLPDQQGSAGPASPRRPREVWARCVGNTSTEPRSLDDGRVGIAWPIGGGLSLLAAFAAPPAPVAPLNWGLPLLVVGGMLSSSAGA